MAIDARKNFAKGTVSTGYDAAAVSIALTTGHGARFPAVPFNATWWNSTDYPNPADDPNAEIVRVTGIAGDNLTLTRAQESTSASTKNTAGKTYLLLAGPTAKTITDIATDLALVVPLIAPLVNNGGMETAGAPLGSWTAFTLGTGAVTRDTSIFRSGTASAKLTANGASHYAGLQQALLSIGLRYRLGFWARSGSGPLSVNARMDTVSASTVFAVTPTWTFCQIEAVAVGATFQIWNNSVGDIYIDDVVLTPLLYDHDGAAAAAQAAAATDATTKANAAQAAAIQRANHTGTQAQSTIVDLVSDLAGKAPLASPALTGNPTAPTQLTSDESTKLATTAFVKAVIAQLINSSPAALDTLDELAAALGDDPNFAATVSTALGQKLVKTANLSDLSDLAQAKLNLALAIADIAGLAAALAGKEAVQTAVSQAEAEAGTLTTLRSWTPERIKQAILALMTWSTLSGKPSVFPPDTHGHAISDVTGLQTALDAKKALPAWSALSGTSPALTFTDQEKRHLLALTGDTTFTASGYAQGREIRLYLTGDSVLRTLGFPANWKWKEGAPDELAASKTMEIKLTCTDGNDTGVSATYGVET